MTELRERPLPALPAPETARRFSRPGYWWRAVSVVTGTALAANLVLADKSAGWFDEQDCATGTAAEASRLTHKLMGGFPLPRVYKARTVDAYSREMAAKYNVSLPDFASPYEAIDAATDVQSALGPLKRITRQHFDFETVSHTTDTPAAKRQIKSTVRRLENIPPQLLKGNVSTLWLMDPLPDGYNDNSNGLAKHSPLSDDGRTRLYVKHEHNMRGTPGATFAHELTHAFYNQFSNYCPSKPELYKPIAAANPPEFAYTQSDEIAANWQGTVLRSHGSRAAGEDAADIGSALLTPLDTLDREACITIRTSKVLQQKIGVVASAFNQVAPGTGDYAVEVLPFACTQAIR